MRTRGWSAGFAESGFLSNREVSPARGEEVFSEAQIPKWSRTVHGLSDRTGLPGHGTHYAASGLREMESSIALSRSLPKVT